MSFSKHMARLDDTPGHLVGLLADGSYNNQSRTEAGLQPIEPESITTPPGVCFRDSLGDLPSWEDEYRKVCPECKESLPPSEYGRHVKTKDGLQPQCRECASGRRRDDLVALADRLRPVAEGCSPFDFPRSFSEWQRRGVIPYSWDSKGFLEFYGGCFGREPVMFRGHPVYTSTELGALRSHQDQEPETTATTPLVDIVMTTTAAPATAPTDSLTVTNLTTSLGRIESFIRARLDLFSLSPDDLELIKAVKDIRMALDVKATNS